MGRWGGGQICLPERADANRRRRRLRLALEQLRSYCSLMAANNGAAWHGSALRPKGRQVCGVTQGQAGKTGLRGGGGRGGTDPGLRCGGLVTRPGC